MSVLPDDYRLSDDPDEIDARQAHAYLARSYWAAGIPLSTVEASIANSFCVAIFHKERQVGFARVISDFATFAYLADVYVLEDHRGHGLASAMLAHLQNHPRLQGLRRWLLFTVDAQDLYRKAGWETYPHPERVMVRERPDIYR